MFEGAIMPIPYFSMGPRVVQISGSRFQGTELCVWSRGRISSFLQMLEVPLPTNQLKHATHILICILTHNLWLIMYIFHKWLKTNVKARSVLQSIFLFDELCELTEIIWLSWPEALKLIIFFYACQSVHRPINLEQMRSSNNSTWCRTWSESAKR